MRSIEKKEVLRIKLQRSKVYSSKPISDKRKQPSAAPLLKAKRNHSVGTAGVIMHQQTRSIEQRNSTFP
ncbi:MAG: hypothetical protein D4R43_04010 [Sphingobacteriales bacterium]|nr:MAG: hypothetical protein D4R43_04010 [Sphingobacteriales bacterium]